MNIFGAARLKVSRHRSKPVRKRIRQRRRKAKVRMQKISRRKNR
jgi:hypothetical protein